MSLPTVYNPQSVEEKWYQYWLKRKYFHAEVDPQAKPYCIVIPPPNVTGVLHLGHALDNTLQDMLIRWRRMQGYNTLVAARNRPRRDCHPGQGGRSSGQRRIK